MSERGYGNSVKVVDRFGVEYREHTATKSNYSTDPTFASAVWEVMDSAGNLLLTKHKAYGPKNISQAPGGPENGLRVRMWDKMSRLNHILENPEVDVNDESLEDTLKDLLNYCAIFILVRTGQWPAQ
jgi:hypothetical protein